MAEIEKKEKQQPEKFKLTGRIMTQGGYIQEIDGRKFIIDYDYDFNGNRVSRFATVCEETADPVTGTPIFRQIKPEVTHLEGLTDKQVKSLTFAKIIELTKAQQKHYKDKFWQPMKEV